jgi:uroporphyrinogen III methyltransferase/synthase
MQSPPGVSRMGRCTLGGMNDRDGVVYLVGAGPGDPRLATVRAVELIERADVILYDRLVPASLLDRAREHTELIYVGKRPGQSTSTQEEINRLLVEHGAAGRVVVRLKGGDPFVFGRGGEEAEALAEAGVRFEVVPGVTAGIAAPAHAGIPVTHRDDASAVAFVTAHEDPTKQESALDWSALAAFPGTLVFYMGVRALPALAAELIRHGRQATEPAAVIERGTLPGQRTETGPLEEIGTLAAEAGIQAPAVTVVGPVAALGDRLAWLHRAPLFGRRVAVTRARAQASGLARRLEELGAEVLQVPAIRIEPRPEGVRAAIDELGTGRCDVLCLTSPNGAELLMAELDRQGLDARILSGTRVAAIGPGTAAVLRDWGIRADVVPERSIAESLADDLVAQGVRDQHVLIPRASEARDVLPRELEQAGADVSVIALYDTVRERLDEDQLERLGDAEYVTFTSSSTVRFLVEAIGGLERFPQHARVVSIGPVTTRTARDIGLDVHVEAGRHDLDGLVEALLRDAPTAAPGTVVPL